MEPLLVGRDGDLLLVDSVLDVDGRLVLLAVVWSCVDRFLHSKEITASVLCHNKVIINDMSRQFRNYLHDLRKEKIDDLACTCSICVCIVLKTFRMLGICSLRKPHVVFPCRLVSKGDEPLLGNRVRIDYRKSVFCSYLLYRIRIISMAVCLEVALVVEPSA